ncbi:helix-turn-helix transcriptional regulator [Niveibacterium sp. 24ML]|uniref:helix-turn-helix transcriptional regulator n=1 Tax=Niveibacterium sp. 24ML TaxID=2985512 RepID=UPI00226D4174|nr:helix-turn-helix transcriptional regulator [Niveibacterium sp. 24ML]MCX9158297.1 helix-turn-helix transcriptional regulator [Niveibacterium sp. 24ML]
MSGLRERAGLSGAPLHQRFIAQFGESPMAQLNALRMQRAALLLREGERLVGAIAESVVYADALDFSYAFKASIGTSPSQYRSRHGKPFA